MLCCKSAAFQGQCKGVMPAQHNLRIAFKQTNPELPGCFRHSCSQMANDIVASSSSRQLLEAPQEKGISLLPPGLAQRPAKGFPCLCAVHFARADEKASESDHATEDGIQ